MERVKFKKALLAKGTALILMAACSTEPAIQESKPKIISSTSNATRSAPDCISTPVNLQRSSEKQTELRIIAPRETDAWKTSIGVTMTGNTVRVLQIEGNGRTDEPPLRVNNPIAIKDIDLRDTSSHVDFIDPISGTTIDVAVVQDRLSALTIPLLVSFCQRSS